MLSLLNAYLKEIGQFPLLTPEKEIFYSKQIIEANRIKEQLDQAQINLEQQETIRLGAKAEQIMFHSNLRLVVSVAKKYKNRDLELSDLIQEGSLGLIKAIQKYDPKKGNRFSTVAYWWIRQSITRAISDKGRLIRFPVHLQEQLNKIKKIQKELLIEEGSLPTVKQIAVRLNKKPQNIRKILQQEMCLTSLNIPVGQEKKTNLGDLLKSDELEPETKLIEEEYQKNIKELLNNLSSLEKTVIELQFGINYSQPWSRKEIGQKLEITSSQVRQIENRAMRKLRTPRLKKQIQSLL
ncbi:RNA polymerase sigma factor RpoD/SigA [Chroococcus sp. FPU101]|uniref:sigma-70 family RNA polymerase sigma factor n=1 Tax=Chroococcus sp. FPU101 TaxID=1974212 RepID=UPI001A8C85E5|nr:sigma-70 family RNA polymerase sigma factor [Chroococcus sp. FPU101]GFE69076.1 group2 RNA polymerase sigma factor [Chroococcus sp. FPU101]